MNEKLGEAERVASRMRVSRDAINKAAGEQPANERLGEAERQLPFDRDSREALPAKLGGEH